ncbi:MAG: LysR family transcriptional regulator [Xanthomonadales bacterium]|nr:LysR family transcriptional regulator [Xanthomonadales bacterium]
MFDWNDVQVYLAIARGGSLAAAARTLKVNHSTVFRRLNAFEEALGVRLFERLPSGYALTPEGDSIRAEAEAVEGNVIALGRKIAGRDFALRGDIRVTAPHGLATGFLAQYLPDFIARYPGIRIEIAASDSDFDLNRREADVALRATTQPPEHLVGRQVASLCWWVYASPAYLERMGRPVGMDALAQHRVIGADAAFQRLPVFAWLARNLADDAIIARAGDLETMAALACEAVGLALLPSDQHTPRLQRLFAVEPRFSGQLWLLTHPDLRQVARIRTFMEFLAERLRSDPRLTEPAPGS